MCLCSYEVQSKGTTYVYRRVSRVKHRARRNSFGVNLCTYGTLFCDVYVDEVPLNETKLLPRYVFFLLPALSKADLNTFFSRR